MSNDTDIIAVKTRVTADLLKLPNVTGVDVGRKYMGNELNGSIAIRVFVSKKQHDIEAQACVPSEIEGYQTDVIERTSELCGDQTRYGFFQGGMRLNTTKSGSTLGAVVHEWVRDNSVVAGYRQVTRLLTTFHGRSKVGSWVFQGGDASLGADGVITKEARVDTSEPIDACLVSVSHPELARCGVLEIGPLLGKKNLGITNLGEVLKKRGSTTGLTYGTLDGIAGTDAYHHGDPGKMTAYNNLLSISAPLNQPFVSNGDSGALVVHQSGYAVGLVISGGTYNQGNQPRHSVAFAHPIQSVLTALGCELCTDPQAGKQPFKNVPSLVARLIMGVADDGGGIIVLPSGQVVPLPPRSPLLSGGELSDASLEMLRGIVIAELAKNIEDRASRRAIEVASLELIKSEADRLLLDSEKRT